MPFNAARRLVTALAAAAFSIACALCVAPHADAQRLQHSSGLQRSTGTPIRFDGVTYRPAWYDTEGIDEPEDERPNQGGLVWVYFTNVSDETVRLAYWRANNQDESYWRLGAYLAWDRVSQENLEPGQMGVLEINAVTDDFAAGKDFAFQWVDRETWGPVGEMNAKLSRPEVEISLIHFLPELDQVVIHVRHTRDTGITKLTGLSVEGAETQRVTWADDELSDGETSIARVRFAKPLARGSTAIVRVDAEVDGEPASFYSHRRVFADRFPIGTWGAEPPRYAEIRAHHIDTCIKSGRPDDDFFGRDAARFGLNAIVSGTHHSLNELRALGDHPSVAGVMLADEPDWSEPPSTLLYMDKIVRHHNPAQPTYLNLCRNVKFFEYGPIADIPSMDHYCVAAPSSSRWPESFGTRLEEAGYYTRDLKLASEPKPIWVWSQGLHTWDGRPEYPTPTREELAFQLCQSLAYGAKGILWFTFRGKAGREYPDTKQAVQEWGRIMTVIRRDLLATEPTPLRTEKPGALDVAALVGWDRVFLILGNTDYDIRRDGYRWRPIEDCEFRVELPSWIDPADAFAIDPTGLNDVTWTADDEGLNVELGRFDTVRVIVVANSEAVRSEYQQAFEAAKRHESAALAKAAR